MRQDLIDRYGEARLPRYTSYPTAPHFSDAVGPDLYGRWLGALAPDTVGSLYVHIPFCRRMCWYCGCHTTVTLRDKPIAAYLGHLSAEIDMVAAHIGRRLPVAHLHFGGGTPTIVAPEAFLDLTAVLRRTFEVRPDAEIAIEIDPRTLTPEMADALGTAGVTRASLGVQTLDARVQREVARVQTFDTTADAAGRLRRAGIADINVDLIYGFPHQTVASCVETVDQCLALAPARFAVFGYAHVPSFKKHQRRINAAALPDGPARNAQSEAIAHRLEAAGYRRVGIDHYAHPNDAMARALAAGRLHRNFQGYTTDAAAALIGLGASAIARLPQGYAQNETVLHDYAAAIGAGRLATAKGSVLTDDDRLRAALIERLMCDFRVDVGALCGDQDRATAVLADASDALDRLADDGIIRRTGTTIEVEPEARSLVRAVAASFDTYLARSTRSHSPAL